MATLPLDRILPKSFMAAARRWHWHAQGFHKLGLRFDDILEDETALVQQAIKRLPPRVLYDRMFRIRRALQCSLTHKLLPKEDWTKYEEDYPYLTPIVEQIKLEMKERNELDALRPRKAKDADKTTPH